MPKRFILFGILVGVFGLFIFGSVRAAILDIQEKWTSSGDNQANAWYGSSIASAGDVNNDGYKDVLIGAPQYNEGAKQNTGKAYLYLGSGSGLATTPAWTSVGDDEDDAMFGFSVASAGDVNRDGYDDVIIGAIYLEMPQPGKAFLYLGSASGLSSVPAWTSTGGGQIGMLYGGDVASAGDVNSDGYDDVLVSAPYYDSSLSNVGRVYLYLGSASGLAADPVWTSSGDDQLDARFGNSISSAGDVNRDGYDDVIIGSNAYNFGGKADVGKVFLYLGTSSGLLTIASWTSMGEEQLVASFGSSVSQAGDVNNDGYSDIIIGALNFTTTKINAGKAYLYLGSADGLATTASWTSSGDDLQNANFGSAVASAGDVNGDGYSDVIIGSYQYGDDDAGKAYLYLGSSSGLITLPIWVSLGNSQADAMFGYSVASAGDINKDGYGEIIIGAANYDTAFSNAGKAYVYVNLAQYSMAINSGEKKTGSRDVLLAMSVYDNPTQMIISEKKSFSGASWEAFSASKAFKLFKKSGKKTVYAKFRDQSLVESKRVSATIRYLTKPKFVTKSAKKKNEILANKKDKKYKAGDFDLIFKKYPKSLKIKKRYIQVELKKKYPKGFSEAKRMLLKKHWLINSDLYKYYGSFRIKFVFKYSQKEFNKLKKNTGSLKKNQLYLKAYDLESKTWFDADAMRNIKKNTFTLYVDSWQGLKKFYFAIGR